MNTTLYYAIQIANNIRYASDIKVGRNFYDFFADRVLQASTKPTLLSFAEYLAKLINADVSKIQTDLFTEFVKACGSDDSKSVLVWIREYYKTFTMLTRLHGQEEIVPAIENIKIDSVTDTDMGTVLPRGGFDIPISMRLLAPLSHGSDTKAGNATLFRRHDCLTSKGKVLSLPYYAGNAIRGQMRDLLADHFLSAIDVKIDRINPQIALWFFYMLYSGGALGEDSNNKALVALLTGVNHTVKIDGMNNFRNMIPHLSVLGCAVGNRIFSGRINVASFEPVCKEHGTHETLEVSDLLTWEYLTRREDLESHEENNSMIAVMECLKQGTEMTGGIDVLNHASELERSVIGKGLQLLSQKPNLGGNNRMGFGKVFFDIQNMPDPSQYDAYLADNKNKIIEYLKSIGAFDKSGDVKIKPEKEKKVKKEVPLIEQGELDVPKDELF